MNQKIAEQGKKYPAMIQWRVSQLDSSHVTQINNVYVMKNSSECLRFNADGWTDEQHQNARKVIKDECHHAIAARMFVRATDRLGIVPERVDATKHNWSSLFGL